ncbi:hypothetical protein ARMSODRAFT_980464 [Armillaria solidipes]|uniref:Uncharacterized protein n=1 Tax=Armillaria solidipes TaxID=1076256 RepID=A0A2H3BIF0_9AGAR|nr:hypothetical protein ARMSODRAFT_980464 [Armillaria solidipes]
MKPHSDQVAVQLLFFLRPPLPPPSMLALNANQARIMQKLILEQESVEGAFWKVVDIEKEGGTKVGMRTAHNNNNSHALLGIEEGVEGATIAHRIMTLRHFACPPKHQPQPPTHHPATPASPDSCLPYS